MGGPDHVVFKDMLGSAYFELLRTEETWLHVHLRCGVVAHHTIAIVNMGSVLIKQTSIARIAHKIGARSIMSFLPLGPLGLKGYCRLLVRRRRRSRRRTHSFGYYTNMVQQIKFIIHTNIQPFPALFSSKVKVIGQRSKYGDDLITISAFHRLSKWPPPGD